jgi:hypothetical protein
LADIRAQYHSRVDFPASSPLYKKHRFMRFGPRRGALLGCGPNENAPQIGAQEHLPASDLCPARSNAEFILDQPITHEAHAASYNNFYEFSVLKGAVYKKAARLRT